MAANQPYITDKIVADVNFWRKYRNPQAIVLSKAVVSAYYRLHKYVDTSLPGPGPAPKFPGWPPQRPLPPPQTPTSNQPFLDKPIPEIAAWPNSKEGTKWKGVKYLGEGGYAQAGLWRYSGPIVDGKPSAREVVVKELFANKAKIGMGMEAQYMSAFFDSNAQHVVRLLVSPVKTTGAIEGLGNEWDGKVRRLIMEYCSLGDLFDLKVRRIRSGTPFEELTLWQIFNCLVDGIACMEYGMEFEIDASNNNVSPRPQANYLSRVHFDLKPENIFLSDDRTGPHPTVPIQKVGDFGLAEKFYPNASQSVERDRWHYSLRRSGTRDYFAPEQFTERWDHADWRDGRVAGRYGSATNIWGVGCIMFELVTLSYDPPDHKVPFLPSFELNGSAALGITYGVNLQTYGVDQGQKCSQTLIDLIYECLYEKPEHRPSLVALKIRVLEAIETCILAGSTPEPWSAFLPPAPPLPPRPQATGAANTPAPPPQALISTIINAISKKNNANGGT